MPLRRMHLVDGVLNPPGASDTTAPTVAITALSAVANVVAMRIVWSEQVSGFAVGDITISAGGSLANFATADNITFTVDWTLATGANTMDINAGVCTDVAGNANTAATQYALTYLVVQPNGTAGLDTMIRSYQATTNYGTGTTLNLGDHNNQPGAGNDVMRTLIKFAALSDGTIPATATVLSCRMTLTANSAGTTAASNNRSANVYRVLRAWVETEATWNIFSTGNNWGTAGCSNTTSDREATSIGTPTPGYATTDAAGTAHVYTLTASAIQEIVAGTFTNNGFIVVMDAENDDLYENCSSDHTTPGNRPKLEVVYHPL